MSNPITDPPPDDAEPDPRDDVDGNEQGETSANDGTPGAVEEAAPVKEGEAQ